jgi:hypothetical protein
MSSPTRFLIPFLALASMSWATQLYWDDGYEEGGMGWSPSLLCAVSYNSTGYTAMGISIYTYTSSDSWPLEIKIYNSPALTWAPSSIDTDSPLWASIVNMPAAWEAYHFVDLPTDIPLAYPITWVTVRPVDSMYPYSCIDTSSPDGHSFSSVYPGGEWSSMETDFMLRVDVSLTALENGTWADIKYLWPPAPHRIH